MFCNPTLSRVPVVLTSKTSSPEAHQESQEVSILMWVQSSTVKVPECGQTEAHLAHADWSPLNSDISPDFEPIQSPLLGCTDQSVRTRLTTELCPQIPPSSHVHRFDKLSSPLQSFHYLGQYQSFAIGFELISLTYLTCTTSSSKMPLELLP